MKPTENTPENTENTTQKDISMDPAHTSAATADHQDGEPKKILVIEDNLRQLIDDLKEQKSLVASYRAKEDTIAECAMKALDAVGLIDKATGQVVPELKTGEGVMSRVLSAVKENFSVMEFMLSPEKAGAKMAEKFSFFKMLVPIFEDYANRKKHAA